MDTSITSELHWKPKSDPIRQFRPFLREWMEMYFEDPPTKPEQRKLCKQARELIMDDLKVQASLVFRLKRYDREVRDKSKDVKLQHPDQYFRRQRELYIYKVLRDLHIAIYDHEFQSPIDRDGDYIMHYIYDSKRYKESESEIDGIED